MPDERPPSPAPTGLTDAEAQARLKAEGHNELARTGQRTLDDEKHGDDECDQ